MSSKNSVKGEFTSLYNTACIRIPITRYLYGYLNYYLTTIGHYYKNQFIVLQSSPYSKTIFLQTKRNHVLKNLRLHYNRDIIEKHCIRAY